MAVQRGSTSDIRAIKEVTPGTTPATPTLIELPVTSFSPKLTNTLIRSNQIRAHPFVDQISKGRVVYDLALEYELQGANHDMLAETMFGGVITTKALVFTDALKTLSIEEMVAAGDFNSWTYGCFTQMSLQVGANDSAPIKVSLTGLALAGTFDAASTISSSVTPATSTTPWVFAGGSLTLGAGATPVSSASFTLNRALDPLMVLGSVNPRELVLGAVTATGQITVPYDTTGNASGTTMASATSGFTDQLLTLKMTDAAATNFRQFAFGKTKFAGLDRQLNSRGMRMQVVNWEAMYDGSSTICTMTTQ